MSTSNAFITYNKFIKLLFEQRCENKKVAEIYANDGGFKKFKASYIKYNGFAEYLVHIQRNKLNAIQVYHLAKAFCVYGKRSPTTLPYLLSSCEREFQLEMPVVYGILSKEYWLARFDLFSVSRKLGRLRP